jgi:hypothetical protein
MGQLGPFDTTWPIGPIAVTAATVVTTVRTTGPTQIARNAYRTGVGAAPRETPVRAPRRQLTDSKAAQRHVTVASRSRSRCTAQPFEILEPALIAG